MAEEPDRRDRMPVDFPGTDPFAVYLIKKMEMDEDRKRRDEDARSLPKNRFDWTINTGNVLTIIVMVLGFLAAYVGWTNSITIMQEAIKQNQRDIQSNTDADRIRSEKYAPRIEKLEGLVPAIIPRQDNQADSLRDLRNAVTDLVKVTGQMHEDMAVFKIQLDRERGPHGQIELPTKEKFSDGRP